MFTDGVREQIARLGGRLPEDFEPREWVVSTPAGERQVPDWAQALFAVVFEAGDLRADDYSDYLVAFYGTQIEPSYFKKEKRRAWHGVGHKGDYYWYVADLDDTSADPMVHTLDMEGGDDAFGAGTRLSVLLAGLKVIAPAGDGDRFALACSAGDVAVAAEELAGGAGLGPLDDTGITPLHLAAMSRSTDLVRLLLEAGADARAAIAYDTQTPWTYVDADAYSSGDLHTGTTALHLALDRQGGLRPYRLYHDGPVDEIVRLLLDAGADPDAIDGIGWTPMLLATESPQIVRLMLAAGADPNLTGALRPPLVSAVGRSSASEDVVRLLLAAGADANGADRDGTALSAAAWQGSTTVIQLLLDAGADPNRPDPQTCSTPGRTPLFCALDRPANMELLLAAGADPNARTQDGFTPLITALLRSHLGDPVDVVMRLVRAGAEVDAAVEEATIRAYVAEQYKPKKPLADLTATTPLGIAKHLRMRHTAAYLTKHGAAEVVVDVSGGSVTGADGLGLWWLGGGLGALVTESGLLPALESDPAGSAVAVLGSERGSVARWVFERVAWGLGRHRYGLPDRLAQVVLGARVAGAEDLAGLVLSGGLPVGWVARWAVYRVDPPHLQLTGHDGEVGSVALGQVGDRAVIVSGADDKTVRVWDASTGAPLGEPLTGHTDEVWSVATGHIGDRAVIVSGSKDETVRIWDAATGAPLGEPLTGHGLVRSVAIGHIGDRAVIVSGADETVRIWDAATGAPLGEPLTGHGLVRSVAIGHIGDRAVIVSGRTDGSVRVWDATTGDAVGPSLPGRIGAVLSVAMGQVDGRTIIVSGSVFGSIRVWDADTGDPLGQPLTGHTDWVRSVATGRIGDRAVIVSGSKDETVRVWDAATGAPLGEPLTGHAGEVWSVATGHIGDRAVIVSGSADKTVRMWKAATGDPVGRSLTGHADQVLSVAMGQVDGRTLVVSGSADGSVRMWDATTGDRVGPSLTGHTRGVWSVATGHIGDRAMIVSGSADKTVRMWNATTGDRVGPSLTGHTDWVRSVAVIQLGERTVIVSGSDDRTVRMWDAATGDPLGQPLTGHTEGVLSVTVGQVSDRTDIVSGSADGSIRVWDATTGDPLGQPLTGHIGGVWSVATGHIGDRAVIISGSEDRTVRMWDAATGDPLGQPLTGHTDGVWSVATGHIGDRAVIISGSEDKTVRIWNPATGTQIGLPIHMPDIVNAVAFTAPDELAVSTQQGIVAIRFVRF